MKTLLIIIYSFGIPSDFSFAKGATPKAKPTNSDSSGARSNRKFGVGIRGGNFAGGFYGAGLEGQFLLNKNFQFAANYYSGSRVVSESEVHANYVLDKLEPRVTLATALSRYYFGNSFFGGLGIGYRTANDEIGAHGTGSDNITISINTRTLLIIPSVGNCWTWDSGFYIGADWIGYGFPISSAYGVTTDYQGNSFTQEDVDDLQLKMEKASEKIANAGNGQWLLINLGFLF